MTSVAPPLLSSSQQVPKGPVVLATGGTGGHVMPAIALGAALVEQSHPSFFIIDKRAEHYLPPALKERLVLSFNQRRPTSMGFWKELFQSFKEARDHLKALSPACVIAFGGYSCLPASLAALTLKIPLYLHEQNAVLGKAHRLLLPFAKRLFLSFAPTAGITSAFSKRCLLTGVPVRREFHLAPPSNPLKKEKDAFHILVLGGSQGAAFFSEVLPKAMALLPNNLHKTMKINQQCRTEMYAKTRLAYGAFQGEIDLKPFYDDIVNQMKSADLIISRAGSSTLAELASLEKKALLVPFKGAIYDHQTANAYAHCARGGGWMIPEKELTPPILADFIKMCQDSRNQIKKGFIPLKRQPEKTIIDCLDLLI